jgi:hypothetical protein
MQDQLDKINLIAVHPVGRAGSVLVQSLFDGHPSILTLPSLGEIYSHISEKIDDPDKEIDIFIKKYPHIFDSTKGYFGYVGERVSGYFGPDGDEHLHVDIHKFKESVKKIILSCGHSKKGIQRKQFFKILHLAYSQCWGLPEIGHTRFIFYHPHCMQEFPLLLKDFPEMYFILMTRDPRQDWESWRKVLALRRGLKVSELTKLDMLINAVAYSSSANEVCKFVENFNPYHLKVIDLADLHVSNKKAIGHLCDWLGLEFKESLLQSTFNGKLWLGNAANRTPMQGLDPTFSDKWKQNLISFEVESISTLNFGAISCFRYEPDGVRTEADLDIFSQNFLSHSNLLDIVFSQFKASIKGFLSFLNYSVPMRVFKFQVWGRWRHIVATSRQMGNYFKFRSRNLPNTFLNNKERQNYLSQVKIPNESVFPPSRL